MKYAIKETTAEIWKPDLSRKDIEQELAAGKISGDWLVCPQGDAGRTVSVSKFLADATVFDAASSAVTAAAGAPAATKTPPTSSIARRHDLDALRATAMLLGIALHAGLAYVTFPFWPVRDVNTSAFFDVMNSALHGFRMPLFFMISGFFTAMLWRKRGLGALIKHRAKRILLPLVVLLIPIQALSIGMIVWLSNPELAATDANGRLGLAAKDNDVATLKQLLKDGVSPNAVEPGMKLPALNWAALNGSHDAAELLLQAGAKVDIRSEDRSTPLGHAAFMGHADLVELLLANGADVNAVNQHQATPLDSTQAPDGITRMAAGFLKLKVNYDELPKMREVAAKVLLEHGGRSARELGTENSGTGEAAQSEHVETGAGPAAAARGESDSLTERYRRFISWPGFQQPMVFGHLWFLYFLCLILVPYAAWAWIAGLMNWNGPPAWMLRSPGVLVWLVPLTMVPQWFNGLLIPSFGPDTSLTLTPFPHVLVLYAVYFFVGAAYFDCAAAEQPLGRCWWILLPLALLVVFPIGMAAVHDPGLLAKHIPAGSIRLIAVFAQALYAWLMIFGMIGLFKKICAQENQTVRFVSDSSYWLYLAHIPLLFPIQSMLRSLDVSAFIKMPVVCLLTTGILLVSYRFMVRYTWLGRMLNGRRDRPEAG